MKDSKLMSISAATLAAALLATPPAIAQEAQLEDSVAIGLSSLGIDTETLGALSTEQITEIQAVLNGTDEDSVKTDRIERIIAMDDGPTTGLGVTMLEDSVLAEMASLGVDTTGVEALSVDQLAQIENVVSSSDEREVKRERIERIMASR